MAKARQERIEQLLLNSAKARVETFKSRIVSESGAPLMNFISDLSSLKYQLESEKAIYNQYLSQNSAPILSA
jgi:hypothetical protein